MEDHPSQKGKSTVEVIHTILHAGGKFDHDTYKFSGGLHGVGVSVVNFLSDMLEVEVMKDGGTHRQRYQRGIPATPLEKVGPAKKTGTKTRFHPDLRFSPTSISITTRWPPASVNWPFFQRALRFRSPMSGPISPTPSAFAAALSNSSNT